jgi:hypothetical protein
MFGLQTTLKIENGKLTMENGMMENGMMVK